MTLNSTRTSKRKDYGDFQTPPALVVEVLSVLEGFENPPRRIIEPTCGIGRFIAEILGRADAPVEIRGFEIQPEHAELARLLSDPSGRNVSTIEVADLFSVDLRTNLSWSLDGPMLVVGNLPWVTTSALGASGGVNGPARTNHKKLRGIDAMTGESNFDISEAIWFKLIRELAHERPTIALLCKTGVARSVLRSIESAHLPITRATLWKLDAKRWFRASVDACLLRVEVGPGLQASEAEVFAELSAKVPESTLGLGQGRLIADVATHRRVAFADGRCPLQWRQGLKHDASPVMELIVGADGSLTNKLVEDVDVEAEHLYPLLKGTDLAGPRRPRAQFRVIVTQSRLGDDTRLLESTAPRLWAYLEAHSAIFEKRKSSIYRGRPPFAMFGVGDYSFAPFKVAISGLHKSPRFRVVGSVEGRPTMLDDTCYFLPCRTLEQATLLEETLNGSVAIDLLKSLIFPDAKRPITKGLLQRIDLKALLDHVGKGDHWQSAWESDAMSRMVHPSPA